MNDYITGYVEVVLEYYKSEITLASICHKREAYMSLGNSSSCLASKVIM